MENANRTFIIEVANLQSARRQVQQVYVAFEQCPDTGRRPNENLIDLWIPLIAPSSALVNRFKYDEQNWHEFERRYRRELLEFPTQCEGLRSLACRTIVTLVYLDGNAMWNAAIALKNHLIELECQRRWNAGWMVGGHTAPVRNEIERYGGLWFGWHKAWMMPDGESCDYIRSLLPGDF